MPITVSWINPQGGRRFPAALLLILCGGLLVSTTGAAPYTPDNNNTVLATLSDSQQALTPASPPQNEADALRLARAQIDYGRQQGDPRFLGYAQRTLAPFSQPPSPAVSLLWADIEQQRHQFSQARTRLARLLEQHPNQGQGWLMLANIERVQGQFDAARQACRNAANSLPPTTVVLCQSSVQAMTDQHQRAYATLQSLADSPLVSDTTQSVWLQTLIAEMAIQQGEPERAQQALDAALALAPQDAYLRYLQNDLWLQQGHPDAVIADLKNWQDRDNALLRLAIAGQRVQIIKKDPELGGKLEFGTEVISTADGSLAALLGASPGASTAAQTMINIIETCFAERMSNADWQQKMKSMVPSYGKSLINDADLLAEVRQRTLETLKLHP